MKLIRLTRLLVVSLTFAAIRLPAQANISFDLVITNGHIIDGTGSPWYSGDVGIREGKVAAIGNLAAARRKRTIDAAGKVVSIAPLNDAIIQADRPGYEHYRITPDWRTFRQYFARVEKQGMGINLASYVGATQVRSMVLGNDDKQPTADQLEQM